MPRVVSYTPDWLARPRPGFDLFQSNGLEADEKYEGPRKTIAHRGSEVFVAAGRELRWSDLAFLKDAEQDGHGGEVGQGYRVSDCILATNREDMC